MSSRTVLAIPVTWTGLPSTSTTQANILSVFNQVATDFGTSSYGAFTIVPTVTPWQTITEPTNHDLSPQLISAAEAAAVSAGYTPSSYDRIAIMHNDPNFTGDVTNTPGRHIRYVSSIFDPINAAPIGYSVTAHELYHTFGLIHSHFVFVTDGSASPVQQWLPSYPPVAANITGSQISYPVGPLGSSTYLTDDYGDPWSCMGTSFSRAIDPYQKIRLGWLPPSRVTALAKGQSATLTNLDSTSGTAVAFIHPTATRSYSLDYPAKTGLQSSSSDFPTGVRVKVYDYAAPLFLTEVNGYPRLIDTQPAAPGTDAGLTPQWTALIPAGTSWRSPEGWTISVTTLSVGAGAVVNIS